MNQKERKFVALVWDFYAKAGRHALPWRQTRDAYRICVSEVMLQQTQVDRVVPKYLAFTERFPDVHALATSSLRDVLLLWQGLGYNRRAKMLHACAQKVVKTHSGTFPRSYEELCLLPGIGPYTAGAICAFAFDEPIALIETNIRAVYLHHFFHDHTDVSDKELLRIIARTADTQRSREWYYALMDYGSHLKRTLGNPNTRSKHYVKQSVFKGSDRQIRGSLLRLLGGAPLSRKDLHSALSQFEDLRIDAQLQKLCDEGMLIKHRQKYALPD